MNNIEFYEVKDANKTVISFVFDIDYKREDIVKKMMMQRMILNYTKDLKTIKDYHKTREDLYIMNCNNNLIKNYNKAIYEINFAIPKSNIINDFNLDAAIKFIHDLLFNPFVNDNQFDLESFNFELNYLKDKEKDYPHSIGEYASDVFLDFVDEEKKTLLHYDEYINYLNSVTSKEVYEYYSKNIKNNNFKVCVFGNIEEKDNIITVLNKYFTINNLETREIKYYDFLPVLDYKEKIISTKYNQSVLSLFYQFKDLKEEDLIKLEMLYYFLNSRENDLLYTELRYKNNLVYQATAKYSLTYGSLALVAFLDYKLLDKVEDAINTVFDNLKDKNNFELYKSRLEKAIEYDILNDEDNPFYMVKEVFLKNYLPNDILKIKLEKIKNVSFESFFQFLNRIVLTRKMIMKSGDEND